MEQVMMNAVRRAEAGKGAARQCRRDGRVPGVVYGLGQETVAISVPRAELDRTTRLGRTGSVIVSLVVDGAAPAEDTAAIIKSVERQPITREPLCVDFQWVSLKDLITVDVAVELRGKAAGQELGGIIEHQMHALPVRCLPVNIPSAIVVDISPLKIHDSIHVRELVAPPGVEILADGDAVVATVAAPAKVKETREEAELPADVAEAPGEGAGESAGKG